MSATRSSAVDNVSASLSYPRFLDSLTKARLLFRKQYPKGILPIESMNTLRDYWVKMMTNDMYRYWKATPWDFNGIATAPGKEPIACGYFVTTLLKQAGCKINRTKLATCASLEMMKSLVPHQKVSNLSKLDMPTFNKKIIAWGKGLYVIGLDFHTGFIINDGNETWFLHSNYIGRKGVMKEKIMESTALQASKTKWIVSLTADQDFLQNWLSH